MNPEQSKGEKGFETEGLRKGERGNEGDGIKREAPAVFGRFGEILVVACYQMGSF